MRCPPRSEWTRSQMSDGLEKLSAGPASPVARRRRWSEADRLRIVAESYRPGVSVSVVARRNDVNANLLFAWRRRYGKRAVEAGSGGLVPVVVEPDRLLPPPKEPGAGADPSAGRMEIALADGSRVIVDRARRPDARAWHVSCAATRSLRGRVETGGFAAGVRGVDQVASVATSSGAGRKQGCSGVEIRDRGRPGEYPTLRPSSAIRYPYYGTDPLVPRETEET